MTQAISRRGWALPLLLALVAMRFLIVSPAIDSPALWASGRFVYAAQQLLQGAALYRDVWVHVPPLVVGIDALGWALGGLWGIWLVELACLLGAVTLGYRLLQATFGATAAFFGMACGLLGLSLLLQGNQIEEYGLLLQFAALYAFIRSETLERASRWSLLTGILIGLLFFLRPDLIGVGLALVIVLAAQAVLRRSPHADSRLMLTLIGALAVTLIVLAALALSGVLADFTAAVFGYNLSVRVTTGERLYTLFNGVRLLMRAGLPLIALAAWLAAALSPYTLTPSPSPSGRGVNDMSTDPDEIPVPSSQKQMANTLVRVAMIALPLEVVLSALSGTQAVNHLIPWLPTVAILAAYFASTFLPQVQAQELTNLPDSISFSPRPPGEGDSGLSLRGRNRSEAEIAREGVSTVLIALLLAFSALPLVDAATALQVALTHNFSANDKRAQAIEALRQQTRPDEVVLVWGAEPMVNVLSERRSPARMFEQMPLFMPVSQQQALYAALAADVTSAPPAYVLDTASGGDRVPPIDPDRRAVWQANQRAGFLPDVPITPELQLVLDTITLYYRPVARYGDWTLYARAEVVPGSVTP